MPNKTYNNVQANVKFTKASTRTDINIVTEQNPTGETNENIVLTLGKISKWYEALVPTGGSSGKILVWNSSGTAKWNDPLHPTITKSADTTDSGTLSHGGTFTAITSVTRDTNGHVTTLNTKTYTLPASGNTDTKVNVTLATTTKAYLLGTSTTPTATATAVTSVADTGVYLGTTAGLLCATSVQASQTLCANTANSNSAGGLALYGTSPDTYGITFRGTTNKGKHGYVQSDWATYFTMNNAATRGWVFNSQANVASISGAGNAVFNGSVTVGGNTTNTSGCRMQYNSTTQSLDFVFV